MIIQSLEDLGKPYKIYAEILEDKALEQFEGAMALDSVVRGALMPDAHTVYSLPIGAVVACDNRVFPSFVGYDIGCGMCAYKMNGVTESMLRDHGPEIFEGINSTVPLGRDKHSSPSHYDLNGLTDAGKAIARKKQYGHALGSLGSGNHFIELGVDGNDECWIVVHSGSRGVGHGIASLYMGIAGAEIEDIDNVYTNDWLKENKPDVFLAKQKQIIAKRFSRAKPKEGYYGLHADGAYGKDYIQDMNWCLDYALANRRKMIELVLGSVITAVPDGANLISEIIEDAFLINRNHNHATLSPDGLWIHRKGATHAEAGMLGVIPGNMRDGSFIVLGKGSESSMSSSSHGAGRIRSRTKAKEELNMQDFESSMDGIVGKIDLSTLDESPMAYKDIFQVMEAQEDLVKIVTHISPLINIKG